MWIDVRAAGASTRRAGLLLLAALMGACAVQPPAPIEQKSGAAQNGRPPAVPVRQSPRAAGAQNGVYLVRPGDTLYSIAFRFGVDPRRLAEWNALENPDRIFVDQRLRLGPPSRTAVNASGATPARSAPLPGTFAEAPRPVAPKPPQASPSAGTLAAADAGVPVPGSRSVSGIAWQWPASGKTRRAVAASGSEGLEILGTRGQPVLAAAGGQVVYSGNGLRGYGELIIVKHSDTFLSAYAHNEKRLVEEGASVKAGQQIALMGDSEASEVMVHFEIRKSGKAVSPLQFLPLR